MYMFYYYWRFKGNMGGAPLVFYILAATLYNVYACIWVRAVFAFVSRSDLKMTQDYLTDWSLLRIHAKHPLLRDEVLCADHLSVSRCPKCSHKDTPNRIETALLLRYGTL
jgi:hypothetical protein